jgi:hypothetical protein
MGSEISVQVQSEAMRKIEVVKQKKGKITEVISGSNEVHGPKLRRGAL